MFYAFVTFSEEESILETLNRNHRIMGRLVFSLGRSGSRQEPDSATRDEVFRNRSSEAVCWRDSDPDNVLRIQGVLLAVRGNHRHYAAREDEGLETEQRIRVRDRQARRVGRRGSEKAKPALASLKVGQLMRSKSKWRSRGIQTRRTPN